MATNIFFSLPAARVKIPAITPTEVPMPASIPEKFENVAVPVKANIYFGGRAISHTLLFKDGTRKTLGLIYEGSFNFSTAAAETMALVAGTCRVKLKGEKEFIHYTSGQAFKVPSHSSFDIVIDNGICEYVCSYE
jgi:uncharacterized protein YaiE (UPF0345 family)